jgi:membrane fusion protein, multidrug efflux system
LKIAMLSPAGTLRLAIVILSTAGVCLYGCKREATSPPTPPTPEVQVVTVTSQTVPDEPEFIGQIEASRLVEIRSQVTGILKQRFFTEGREVKEGDRLYQIDPVPFRAAFLSAKARVSQAEARLVQAKQNLARVKPLLAEQAVSQKDVDDAVAEELAAKAALEGAKADLVKAEFDLSNTHITAPIEGLIERTRFYEGRLITAQTDLLTIIHHVDPMYVIVSAPESFLLQRQRDIAEHRVQHPGIYKLRGIMTFSDGRKYKHEGLLDFADVGLRTETGSRQARVVFPNPEKTLLPGQFVTVRFLGASKSGMILVPQRAVLQGPKGPVVYVVGEGDKAEMRDVRATTWQADQWLVEAGLQSGERLVVDGIQRIAPGMAVKPVLVTGSEPGGATSATGDSPPEIKTAEPNAQSTK